MTDVVVHTEVKQAQKLISDLVNSLATVRSELAVVRSELAAARGEIATVKQVAAGSVIKSVQVLHVTITSNQSELIFNFLPVNMNKTVINNLGVMGAGSAGDLYLMVSIIDGSTAKIKRSTYNSMASVSLQIVEYY